ncbi:hypothetical protein D3C81_1993430 [compost metagenome]
MQANRVGQQLVVLFGIDQHRQRADLVDQAAQSGLFRLELCIATADFVADACHFQAVGPDIAKLLFNRR